MTQLSKEKWMIQSLLRMAEITDNEEKRTEYLSQVEDIMSEINMRSEMVIEYTVSEGSGIVDFYNQFGNIEGLRLNDIYENYLEFCEDKNFRPLTKSEFSKQTKRYLPVKTVRKTVEKGKQQIFYKEVK